jgi:UrcA family protein
MNKPLLKTLNPLTVSGLVLTLLAGAIPSTAFSQAAQMTRPGTVSRVVHIGDLDSSTAAGAQALYQRITRVAWQVCDQGGPVNLATGVAEAGCRRKAIDDAVRQLDKPQLTALHLQRHPDATMTASAAERVNTR